MDQHVRLVCRNSACTAVCVLTNAKGALHDHGALLCGFGLGTAILWVDCNLP